MSSLDTAQWHVFISYAHTDSRCVDELQLALEASGIPVWRDTTHLQPGEDWRTRIRHAITGNALVFIACFSKMSTDRDRSYQNEELILAIDELRLRRPENPWLFPVRFDDCEIPDLIIGGGRTLASIQYTDLFGERHSENTKRLITAIHCVIAASGKPVRAGADRNGSQVMLPDDGPVSTSSTLGQRLARLERSENRTDWELCSDWSLGDLLSVSRVYAGPDGEGRRWTVHHHHHLAGYLLWLRDRDGREGWMIQYPDLGSRECVAYVHPSAAGRMDGAKPGWWANRERDHALYALAERHYCPQVRLDTLRRLTEKGLSIAAAARTINIPASTAYSTLRRAGSSAR